MKDYIGWDYPYPKLEIVATPMSVAGMEHPGAIFLQHSRIFLRNPTASEEYGRVQTIGHEISHMWFGDLVTMKWFNEVWLKEVFANYFGDKFGASQVSARDFNLRFVLGNFPSAYGSDRYRSSDPLMRSLDNLNEAGLAYGDISYYKAPIIIHQLELLMGPASFKKGIQAYIANYAGGNADFKDLVSCLQGETSEDLNKWLSPWINQPGRPIFSSQLDTLNGKIRKLTLQQSNEFGKGALRQQQFYVTLVYDRAAPVRLKIDMRGAQHEVAAAANLAAPRYIIFNSTGEGYGVFPIHPVFLQDGLKTNDTDALGTTLINLYETMLRSKQVDNPQSIPRTPTISPRAALQLYTGLLEHPMHSLSFDRTLRYIEFIYWRLLTNQTRLLIADSLERQLLHAIDRQPDAAMKKSLFNTYVKIVLSAEGVSKLYDYWKKQEVYGVGYKYFVNDWNKVAYELAVRSFHADEVLSKQLEANKSNLPNFKTFSIIQKAASGDEAVRDNYFNSLQNADNRKEEADIRNSLAYLHHPLRHTSSRKYLSGSLNLLPELLRKNDVFFAPVWPSNIFVYYHDKAALAVIRQYLSQPHKDVPYLLLQRVRQQAEWVERAAELAE